MDAQRSFAWCLPPRACFPYTEPLGCLGWRSEGICATLRPETQQQNYAPAANGASVFAAGLVVRSRFSRDGATAEPSGRHSPQVGFARTSHFASTNAMGR